MTMTVFIPQKLHYVQTYMYSFKSRKAWHPLDI